MAILTENEGRFYRVAGHYVLVLSRDNGKVETRTYSSLQDLARALSYLRPTDWDPLSWKRVRGAVSPGGGLLPAEELAAYGWNLRKREFLWRRFGPHEYRREPVPGVHCRRGGGGYFRRLGTTPERRQACLVLFEEGEVAPRAKRNAVNIPNSWDDYPRHTDHCWKSQRKGRKAWDR